MNMPLPPDELASAYLDDEVTPDERARVETDGALLARVEQLRAVRDALAGETPTRPAADRDAAIAAALAPLSGERRADDLASRRRAKRSGRVGLALVGAAAAAVIAIGVVAASRTGGGGTTTAGGATDRTTQEASTTAGGAATTIPAPAAPAAAATVGGADSAENTVDAAGQRGGTVLALGPIDDPALLRSALNTTSLAAASGPPPNPCPVPSADLVATVVWQGTPAYVYVTAAGDDATVVGQDGCQTLAVVPLT